MTYAWSLAALWLGLALVATLFALWFRVSTALTEIIVGTLAQLILGSLFGSDVLGGNESWIKFLAGAALSTTLVAVVYAVMLEYGFNKTEYGKIVLAACFIKHLGTVLALGFIFAPFSINTLI